MPEDLVTASKNDGGNDIRSTMIGGATNRTTEEAGNVSEHRKKNRWKETTATDWLGYAGSRFTSGGTTKTKQSARRKELTFRLSSLRH